MVWDSSLDKVFQNLPNNKFKYLFQRFCGERLELLNQKGIYPYEYMNEFEKFAETKLPDKIFFYSSLKDEQISYEDYEYAVKIWDKFEMRTINENH